MNNKLRDLFQQPFDIVTYRSVILSQLLHAQKLLTSPEMLEQYDNGDQLYGLGYLTDNEGKEIGLYYTHVPNGDVRRKRVGFRKMLHPYVKYGVDAAIAVFDDGEYWRLSYICDLKGGVTSAKRFSYVFGDPKGQYNTPVGRLTDLGKKRLTLDELHKTFSVDALSKEFFDEYHRHYDRIIAELSRQGNTGAVFHDYVKKMMGRIVFLHFLQKKRWLNDDPEFLSKLFFLSPYKQDFLDQELEPLFFGIFNTEPDKREQLFHQEHWDLRWLAEWEKLPYLNGGLFERDEVDKMKIKLPASLFEQLFEFMASYNFTIDENDPDDADIGIDPEMLGKIFESLLEDNKAKGAFYTPKEIVRYMCKESLIAYLETKVSDNASEMLDTKQSIRTFVEHHELPEELEPYREVLDTALRDVKICDPAIGSGAFPMGLLNELWRCREAIENVPDELDLAYRAELKKEIIENNIYGVDIERGAIDIARLRFWLSIVVDAEKPEPLPNFDYKFMQGNSLIESFEGHDLCHIMDKKIERNGKTYYQSKIGGKETVQVSMDFFSNDTRQNLRIWLKRYFSLTNHKEKIEYRKRINESVKSYIKQQGIGPSAESKLNTLDPSANQDFFLWHTWFKDIFDNGGFDIVIGNPPYIQLQANGGELADLYKECGFKTFTRMGDIYSLFYEQGYNILANSGHLCFITSNKWMRAGYGELTRQFFTGYTNPKIIVDLGGNIFENATVDTNILLFSKSKNMGETQGVTVDKETMGGLENMNSYVLQNQSVCTFKGNDSWVILSPIEQSIKLKMEAIGTPLKDWNIEINYGVKTGCNDAFIISTEKRNKILSNCQNDEERQRTEDLIRPILRGRDIKRYSYKWAGLWLIAFFPARNYNIDDYPSVKTHLESYAGGHGRELLEQTGRTHIIDGIPLKSRKKTNNKWFEVQDSIGYWKCFALPKIVYGQFQDSAEYSFAEEHVFLSSNEYVLITNNYSAKCLLAFLNSKPSEWMLGHIAGSLGGNAKIGQKSNFLKLPVPILSVQQQKQYDDIVSDILSMKKHGLDSCQEEKRIDNLIYQLYNLTPEEIAVIEQ
jgi:type I restriction-modification system DNA methylase subunit